DRSTEILLIAVPDDALTEVAAELSRNRLIPFTKLLVLHTSGAYSSTVFTPLAELGSLTASFHPIQTFPDRQRNVKLQGVSIGIEGSPLAVARAEQLARTLDAHPVVIPAALKPLYHIACVFSSGYLMVILNAIQELSHL